MCRLFVCKFRCGQKTSSVKVYRQGKEVSCSPEKTLTDSTIQESTMEKYLRPAWMQTVTSPNALKSDNDGCNLKTVMWQRPYAYAPSCDSFELDRVSYSPSLPAVSESRPCKSTPAPRRLRMKADSPPMKSDPPPLVKVSCRLSSDAESPSSMNQSAEAADGSLMLKTLHQVTFSSSYLDPYTYQGYDVNHRYLYAPPTEISGFVDEGLTPIRPDKLQSEFTLLENEELCKAPLCPAKSKLTEAKEPPVEINQNH